MTKALYHNGKLKPAVKQIKKKHPNCNSEYKTEANRTKSPT